MHAKALPFGSAFFVYLNKQLHMESHRNAALELSKEQFKEIGYQLIDNLSNFIDTIQEKPITRGENPKELLKVLGDFHLPKEGTSTSSLVSETTDLILKHSLFNGHPKFLGFITSSPAPIGALADLLAAIANPNVGAHVLSPIATEIEKQTIQWLCEFIGVPNTYGGLLVSGGNMANFTGFLAARTAKAPKTIKTDGISNAKSKLTVYCSKTTHTWIEKASILFGLGTNSIRWIETDAANKMNINVLKDTIQKDINDGCKPIMVIGTAGDVSTGVVDNLKEISKVCNQHDLWFHIDGAYGVPAAIIPDLKDIFNGLEDADSIALDPHKWLYNPLEAGCTLVKNPVHLTNTFSSHPEYYNFANNEDEQVINYYEYGLQNSRGFRALKVWMALKQIGRNGYQKLISEDIELSKLLFEEAKRHNLFEAVTQNLSITTFRFVPKNVTDESYLNKLNEAIVNTLQLGGEVFVSNAIIDNTYCLRACFVNFRTSKKDIPEIIQIIEKVGNKLHT